MMFSYLRQLLDKQANDDGLWFTPRSASEDYLQRALCQLHAACELALEAERERGAAE